MRIVHIITRLILGGAQENTLLTVEGLHHRQRDQVTLITGPAIGPEGDLFDRARRQRLDVRVVEELQREIHTGRDWRAYRRLVALLRELRPVVVHTHSSKAGILGRAAAARVGVPVVVHTVHGPPFHRYERWWRNRLFVAAERWAARRTTAFISVCDAMTDQFVAARVAPRERFTTIYSGMEIEPFLEPPRPRHAVRAELGFRDEHVVIAKVARLFDLKGHEYVIDAAAELVRRHPQVRFLFIGDGILRATLEQRIRVRDLAAFFHFCGLVPSDRIPELLHASDVVVHCSLREGLARVLPQGLMAGKPVVSFDIDGAREVVRDGETGLLLDAISTDAVATALQRLVADPALRHRLGTQGRAFVERRFDHRVMVDAIRDLYERYLPAASGDRIPSGAER
jgi:glycosyltransferase involved in cell wall biosynthesis